MLSTLEQPVAAAAEEAPTPPTSNCASKVTPSPFTLGKSSTEATFSDGDTRSTTETYSLSSSSHASLQTPTSSGLSFSQAKFSDPTDAPLVLERHTIVQGLSPASSTTLSSSSSPPRPTAVTTSTHRFRISKHKKKKKQHSRHSSSEASVATNAAAFLYGLATSLTVGTASTASPTSTLSLQSSESLQALSMVPLEQGQGELGYCWNMCWHLLPWCMACDFIKTQIPWTLARGSVVRFWQWTHYHESDSWSTSRTSHHQQQLQPVQRNLFSSPWIGGATNTANSSPSSSSSKKIPSNATRASSYSSLRRLPQKSVQEGVVQGIPNFGQTCFLNSVLQCLASLQPFLIYLERLNQVQQDLQTIGSVSSTFLLSHATTSGGTNTTANIPSHQPCMAKVLLQLLLKINGMEDDEIQLGTGGSYWDLSSPSSSSSSASRLSYFFSTASGTSRFRIDPRPLLKRVGEHHAQFAHSTRGGEQQDAQELLQALLGVVISEAQLDSLTSTSDHMQFSLPYDYSEAMYHRDGYQAFDEMSYAAHGMLQLDERLTLAIAGMEQAEQSQSTTNENASPYSCDLLEPPLNAEMADCALSLSSLLERIDQGQKKQRQIKMQQQQQESSSITKSPSAQNVANGHSTKDSTILASSLLPPEEKKQEDFEMNFRYVATLTGLGSDNKDRMNQHHPNPSFKPLSTSLQIVNSTISSITPSPLSGWLGSTLQCCKCKHVRPIQNSPFLDIPLVPTSIPAYLERAQRGNKTDPAPPSHSPSPPCSLEQCLADFTSVERVQDVECQMCTIQAEISELQDSETHMREAIAFAARRAKAKGKDPFEETKTLNDDLSKVQIRLVKLQTMDPDEDDPLLLLKDDRHIADADGFVFEPSLDQIGKSTHMIRNDARKCLFLTRCPSILCCHIQRNYYDPFLNRMEKCVQFVQFSEYLDLSPYCAYSSSASISWAAGRSKRPHDSDSSLGNNTANDRMLYRLQSIIEHRGNALGGHYVAYRRLGSKWFRASDNNVTPIPWERVRRCQAYMLFYEAV